MFRRVAGKFALRVLLHGSLCLFVTPQHFTEQPCSKVRRETDLKGTLPTGHKIKSPLRRPCRTGKAETNTTYTRPLLREAFVVAIFVLRQINS